MATTLESPRTDERTPTGPRSRRWQESTWVWLAPISAVLLLVFVYPIIEIFRLSFTNASLVAGEPYRYTLEAYQSVIFGSDIRDTIRITFIFVLFSTVFQMLFGLGAALLVNGAERRGLRGTVVTRTTIMTAWAVPGVIIGIIWAMLYTESSSGILNYGLSLLGFSGETPFLSDPTLALASVTVANVWRGTALSMVLSYAGLKTVPDDVYEAAKVDGASGLQTLLRVTIPMMLPIILTNLVLVVVQTFNTFDMVLSLTGGGPGNATEVLALSIYDQIFRLLNLGRGAAIAVVLMAINLVMITMYLRLAARQEEAI